MIKNKKQQMLIKTLMRKQRKNKLMTQPLLKTASPRRNLKKKQRMNQIPPKQRSQKSSPRLKVSLPSKTLKSQSLKSQIKKTLKLRNQSQ